VRRQPPLFQGHGGGGQHHKKNTKKKLNTQDLKKNSRGGAADDESRRYVEAGRITSKGKSTESRNGRSTGQGSQVTVPGV